MWEDLTTPLYLALPTNTKRTTYNPDFAISGRYLPIMSPSKSTHVFKSSHSCPFSLCFSNQVNIHHRDQKCHPKHQEIAQMRKTTKKSFPRVKELESYVTVTQNQQRRKGCHHLRVINSQPRTKARDLEVTSVYLSVLEKL
jgi:hypothetical protein